MPLLSDVQAYGADLMRKLRCARHDQMHRLLAWKYPKLQPERVMRQLTHLSRAMNDGTHYLWPGCKLEPNRIAATDIMLLMAEGEALPVFDAGLPPCILLFLLLSGEELRAVRVYAPEPGSEREYRAIAECTQRPQGHAVVFYIQDQSQIPLLKVSHPHLFVVSDGQGGYRFLGVNKEGGR